MNKSSMTDPELEALLGNEQMEDFVIEQVGGGYVATPIDELPPEEKDEVLEGERIDVQHPTHEELKNENRD